MRSLEEMKGVVEREAGRRRARRRMLTATGAGAVALLLVGVSLTRSGSEVPTDVSTGLREVPSTVATPVPGAVPTTSPAPGADPSAGPGPGADPGAPSPETSTPLTSRPSTTRPSPTTEPGVGVDPIAAPTVPTVQVAPTTTERPATTTTTTPGLRSCTDADFVKTDLQLSVPGVDGLPEGTAPIGRPVELGYSTLAGPDISPCYPPDALQVVSITDARGAEVFHRTFDAGTRNIVRPGTWVRFRAVVPWDPSCATGYLPPPYVYACVPAGVGSYRVAVYDQGANLALTVSLVPA